MDRDDPAARGGAGGLTGGLGSDRGDDSDGVSCVDASQKPDQGLEPDQGPVADQGPDQDLARIHEFIELVGLAARSPRQRERMLRAAGAPITGASLTLLRWIARHGSATSSDLARWLDLDQSTVSRQLRPLEEHRLVSRSADGADRRVARLAPTEHGEALLAAVREVGLHDIGVALDGFTAAERRHLAELLDRMRVGMLDAQVDPTGRSVPPARKSCAVDFS
ncbi:MarR family winged helix-turn-helix transcriptional regulator [Parafrankia sp. EUN1f]|uniref:MarR family winged helix-turn-helix transcriptional regulator n=1 Tax=Parafrankia sp. EUN1f TaxID=102897 RepID=UPI0001C45ED1|nr:MarR family winged helix-turn-helix transcriptional regulator [Parafrankia sp. EUN1f]EFC81898.1 transcriptional regulator, MarR family [Parafrankia sp. EUN1f]